MAEGTSLLWVLLSAAALLVFVYSLLTPPKHPLGIPAVPFWVTLIPLFKDVDQSETFQHYLEEPLRRHGAVKIFFGARWNLLLHRPSYLAELFRNEKVYQKSGNQKKIPHSVLAAFLGDNIISSRGVTWKQYRRVIQPGLQRRFDAEVLARNARKLCDLINDARLLSRGEVRGVAVQELLQRYTIANLGQAVLQTDFGTLARGDAPMHALQMALKQQIFKPVFMNFPFLDRLPIPSRAAARRLVSVFKDTLISSVEEAHQTADVAIPSDKLGLRLLAARRSGELTERQFRDNLTVLYVAGQENPQIALTSTLYLLARHPEAQRRLRDEVHRIVRAAAATATPTHATLQRMPYLAAVVYESLRVLPPLSQLINRRAASDARLGGDDGGGEAVVPRGTYLGYHCYSTHRDADAWGGDAGDFRPERWGATLEAVQRLYRRKRACAEFVAFHGGGRACLGEGFALLEIKVTLCVLVARFAWRLDPTWSERMTPAGPLFPRALRLLFNPIEKSEDLTPSEGC